MTDTRAQVQVHGTLDPQSGHARSRDWGGRRGLLLAGVCFLASVSGCATSASTSNTDSRGELITESDEPEDRKRARIRTELAAGYFEQGQTTVALDQIKQAQAETEVATAEAEISVLQSQRDQLENVLALLVGANASSFALAAAGNLLPGPPEIPAGFPSDLLERRTDIAAAEQQLAAATARIGMAEAEFFPSVSLMGNGGFLSGDIGPLLDVNSLMWTFGPRVRIPVFSGGKDRFNLSRSHAAHDEALAAYRQAFLVAVGDVETSLSNLRHLGTEAKSLGRARDSAVRASRLVSPE